MTDIIKIKNVCIETNMLNRKENSYDIFQYTD